MSHLSVAEPDHPHSVLNLAKESFETFFLEYPAMMHVIDRDGVLPYYWQVGLLEVIRTVKYYPPISENSSPNGEKNHPNGGCGAGTKQ